MVLSGAADVSQLRSNVAAVDLTLDEAEMAELTASAEPPAAYWGTRSELPWN